MLRLLTIPDIIVASIFMFLSNYFFLGRIFELGTDVIWYSTVTAISGFIYAYSLVQLRIRRHKL